MVKWKLFGKSKKEEPVEYQEPTIVDYNENMPMESQETQQVEKEPEQQPLAEHHDTLHAGKTTSKKNVSSSFFPRLRNNF